MPELRRDPIIGRWVIIAEDRKSRPSDFLPDSGDAKTDLSNCPFCPGHEAETPAEILAYHEPGREKDKSGWWLRVIPNKFPALRAEGAINRMGDGMYDRMSAMGAHEVIIESPNHNEHYDEMDDKRAEDIFWAFRDRILDLKKDPRIQYVLIFKNYGKSAGATLSHTHCQLIALPMVPIRVKQEMDGARAYYEYKERCVFCDIIREEQAVARRIVGENKGFIAVEPYASRFPFETWIIPKAHSSHFENIQKHEIMDLTQIMKKTMGKLRRLLKNPSMNYVIHTTPLQESGKAHYHWHIEIMPKVTQVAGFEWGTGFYINTVAPEIAAKLINEA